MLRTLRGESGRAIARALAITHQTVQQHVNSLLARGAIKRTAGGFLPGPAMAMEIVRQGAAGKDRYPPANPTAGGLPVVTDGKRTFTVRREPGTLYTAWSGYVRTTLTGKGRDAVKRMNHHVGWTDAGRTHQFIVTFQPGTGAWGLQYLRCLPLVALSELGEGDPEAVWDRFTAAAVVKWSRLVGMEVDPSPRRSRKVSPAYLGVVAPDVKLRTAGYDVDATPVPGTLEARTQQLRDFLEGGPQAQAAHGDALVELERATARTDERLERVIAVSARVVGMLAKHEDVTVGILRGLVPRGQPPPEPPPPSAPGPEFA